MATTGTQGSSPTQADAIAIAVAFAGVPVRSCTRFPTGLRNWVFDVELASGRSIVVRLGDAHSRTEFAGGVFWADCLRNIGVPVAEVLGADLVAPQPFMLLERLPGTDLGDVFDDLDVSDRRDIANEVTAWQQRAATLPLARGFGYATGFDALLKASWFDVLTASMGRSRTRIEDGGVVNVGWADRVEAQLLGSAGSYGDVEPRAFLHDATTKNVIVDQGRASGLVDVDEMCFGDSLWAVALTRMSLLAAQRDPTYVEHQLAVLDPYGRHERRFELYTALHALGFLSELGQRFNKSEAPPVDDGLRSHLEQVLDEHLSRLAD